MINNRLLTHGCAPTLVSLYYIVSRHAGCQQQDLCKYKLSHPNRRRKYWLRASEDQLNQSSAPEASPPQGMPPGLYVSTTRKSVISRGPEGTAAQRSWSCGGAGRGFNAIKFQCYTNYFSRSLCLAIIQAFLLLSDHHSGLKLAPSLSTSLPSSLFVSHHPLRLLRKHLFWQL